MIWYFFIQNKKENYESSNFMKYVDMIYYINLDHRTDRMEEFLHEMHKMKVPDEKITRISAVSDKKRPDLGCSRSHIKTIDMFINSNYKNCVIFEDDFEWSVDQKTVNSSFSNFFENNIDYHVCMLSSNEIESKNTNYDFVKKITNSQTASGYMVNKNFASELLENFKEGAELLERSYDIGKPNGPEYCVDQYWKRLQPYNDWYMFFPKLGKQRKSFSDIQGVVIDYNV